MTTYEPLTDYTPETGDMICVRKRTRFGRRIRWFNTDREERRRGEKTLTNHIAPVRDVLYIVHATWPRVKQESAKPYLEKIEANDGQWCVMRPLTPLTEAEKIVVRQSLDAAKGLLYSMLEIGLAIPDGLLSKLAGRDVIFFRKLGDILPWVVCSGLAGRVMAAIERGEDRLKYGDPDMLLDYMMKSDKWELLAHTGRWLSPSADKGRKR